MLATDLEFAPGTSDHCKKLVVGMFDPQRLLAAYRTARREHKTPDVVLVCPNMNPDELCAGPRSSLRELLARLLGPRAAELSICAQTAHSVVKLPADSDAMWLVIQLPGNDLPVMCVVYGIVYEQVAAGGTLIGEV